MSAPLIVSADKIIRASRKTYQSIPLDDARAQSVVLAVAASLLDLEDEDYADLVYHLVTAEEIDPDALRWATTVEGTPWRPYAPKDTEPFRSTVPDGYGGGWTGQTF